MFNIKQIFFSKLFVSGPYRRLALSLFFQFIQQKISSNPIFLFSAYWSTVFTTFTTSSQDTLNLITIQEAPDEDRKSGLYIYSTKLFTKISELLDIFTTVCVISTDQGLSTFYILLWKHSILMYGLQPWTQQTPTPPWSIISSYVFADWHTHIELILEFTFTSFNNRINFFKN